MITKFLIAAFVISVLIFILSSMGRNSIEIDNKDHLILKTKAKNTFTLGSLVSRDDKKDYEYLELERYSFNTPSDTHIFYEKITIDADRVFNNSITSNIELIFDTKKLDAVYKSSDAFLVAQLKLKDKTHINLIAESSNDTVLNIVYGFMDDEFMGLLNSMEQTKGEVESLKYKADVISNYKSCISDEKLLLNEFSMSVTE
ncbi:MAG: hypothetical protein GXO30_09125 [Epsilonproteobacteria bacterium]|nr:hypothetical protein [Campylobacterota bacterium]